MSEEYKKAIRIMKESVFEDIFCNRSSAVFFIKESIGIKITERKNEVEAGKIISKIRKECKGIRIKVYLVDGLINVKIREKKLS